MVKPPAVIKGINVKVASTPIHFIIARIRTPEKGFGSNYGSQKAILLGS